MHGRSAALSTWKRWTAASGLVAAASFGESSASLGADPAPPAADGGGPRLIRVVKSNFTVGGAAKATGKGLPKIARNFHWTVILNADAFDFQDAGGFVSSGTFVESGADVVLTDSALGTGNLAEETDTTLTALLGGTKSVTVTSRSQSTRIKKWAAGNARSVVSKYTFDVTIDGGPVKRLTWTFKGTGKSRRVLLLDDAADGEESTGPQVIAALRKAGHFVTDAGFYGTWDGVTPSVSGNDTVIHLQRYDYNEGLTAGAKQALLNWTQLSGGRLIRTEWAAYQMGATPLDPLDQMLPVRYTGEYGRGTTWKREPGTKGHPLAAKLPATFPVRRHGYAFVTEQPDTLVLYRTADGHPALTVGDAGNGTVIHINHGTEEAGHEPPLQKAILRVFVNAVGWTLTR